MNAQDAANIEKERKVKNKNARDWEKRKKKIFRVKKEELCTV